MSVAALDLLILHNRDEIAALVNADPVLSVKLARLELLSCINTALPNDVLVHILGMCYKETRIIWRVCTKWARITLGHPYWNHAKREFIASLPDWLSPEQRMYMQKYWTPFLDAIPTMREQVEWLLRPKFAKWVPPIVEGKGRFEVTYANISYDLVFGKLAVLLVITAMLDYRIVKDGLCKSMVIYELEKNINGVLYGHYIQNDIDGKYIYIEGRYNGVKWAGDCIYHIDRSIPHGKGTWTFPDGSTLSGDNVAFAGKIHDGVDWFAGERMPKRIKLE